MVLWIVRIGLVGGVLLLNAYLPENTTRQEQMAYCQAYGSAHEVEECSFLR